MPLVSMDRKRYVVMSGISALVLHSCAVKVSRVTLFPSSCPPACRWIRLSRHVLQLVCSTVAGGSSQSDVSRLARRTLALHDGDGWVESQQCICASNRFGSNPQRIQTPAQNRATTFSISCQRCHYLSFAAAERDCSLLFGLMVYQLCFPGIRDAPPLTL